MPDPWTIYVCPQHGPPEFNVSSICPDVHDLTDLPQMVKVEVVPASVAQRYREALREILDHGYTQETQAIARAVLKENDG